MNKNFFLDKIDNMLKIYVYYGELMCMHQLWHIYISSLTAGVTFSIKGVRLMKILRPFLPE